MKTYINMNLCCMYKSYITTSNYKPVIQAALLLAFIIEKKVRFKKSALDNCIAIIN